MNQQPAPFTLLGAAVGGAFLIAVALVRPAMLVALGAGALWGVVAACAYDAHRRGPSATRSALSRIVLRKRFPQPPPGTYRAHPPATHRARWPLAFAAFALASILVSITVLQSRDTDPVDAARTSATRLLPVVYEGSFDARGDDGRWMIRERIEVRRSQLRRLLRGSGGARAIPSALRGRWKYRRDASTRARAVYVRSTTRRVDSSLLPVFTDIALPLPLIRLRRTSWAFVPAAGSEVTVSGPGRFIRETVPAPRATTVSRSAETFRIRLGDTVNDPQARRIAATVANPLGRSGIYRAGHDAAFWAPARWLLAAAMAALAAFALARSFRSKKSAS